MRYKQTLICATLKEQKKMHYEFSFENCNIKKILYGSHSMEYTIYKTRQRTITEKNKKKYLQTKILPVFSYNLNFHENRKQERV